MECLGDLYLWQVKVMMLYTVNLIVLWKASVCLPFSYISILASFPIMWICIRWDTSRANEISALILKKHSKCQLYVLTGNRISCYTLCNKDSKCVARLEWNSNFLLFCLVWLWLTLSSSNFRKAALATRCGGRHENLQIMLAHAVHETWWQCSRNICSHIYRVWLWCYTGQT